jgi:hypothetical protein
MMNDEFVSEFVYLCETSGLDPVEALRFLNAQDWRQEEAGYTMQPVTAYEEPEESAA